MRTLGEFYREKLSSRSDLIEKTFENNFGEIKIEQDLFGWKLYSDKKYFECKSEEEARYLKVFFEAGVESIKVPKDDKYLKNILPELENLKMKIDKIINSYLETILNRQIMEKLKQEVFAELMK